MKRALTALVTSIIVSLPVQAVTFIEMAQQLPGGQIVNKFPCTYQETTRFCVDFIYDKETFRAVLDANSPNANIVDILSSDAQGSPQGIVTLEDLLRRGSI